jgi:hypothetical protein
LTIALSEEARKLHLPSFNAKTGTVDLKDVMSLIEKNMRGTEFICKGHPVLNRLALRMRAQEISRERAKESNDREEEQHGFEQCIIANSLIQKSSSPLRVFMWITVGSPPTRQLLLDQ